MVPLYTPQVMMREEKREVSEKSRKVCIGKGKEERWGWGVGRTGESAAAKVSAILSGAKVICNYVTCKSPLTI